MPALESIVQDTSFAARALRRGGSTALLAVVTLGLGIGVSTAMFSVVDAVLLRPLPFDRPERIVLVNTTTEEWRDHPSLSAHWDRGLFSAPEAHQWLERQSSFQGAGAFTLSNVRLSTEAGSETVSTALAMPSLFTALRVTPAAGRLFDAEETEPVVVLTHAFWERRHGGDPAVIGTSLLIDDAPRRVIGVLPGNFLVPGVDAELWTPLRISAAGGMNNHMYSMIGRLRDDVSIERAQSEASAILAAISGAEPGHVAHEARVVPPLDRTTSTVRTPLLILMSAAIILLLAACANVALLLLGAGAARVREIAMRGALGASRVRIARQLLVESVLLSGAGALAGLLVALVLTRVFTMIVPAGMPRVETVGVDLRTFGFAATLGMVTGLLAGALPALSLSRVTATLAWRAGSGTLPAGRLQHGVVAACLGLATVLLIGGGLLTRTMNELQNVRTGFHADGLLTVQLRLPYDRIQVRGEPYSQVRQDAYAARVREAVASLPRIGAVAATSSLPFSGARGTSPVEPEGYTPRDGEIVDVGFRFVSGNYFDVLGVNALHGRLLAPADELSGAEKAMVVNERFARAFWPRAQDAVGRTVVHWGTTYRVVGVVADMLEQDVRGDTDALKFYVPSIVVDNLLIRSDMPMATLIPLLRERLRATDDALVVLNMLPMQERISGTLAEYRYRMRLMTAFSAMAGLFALLGVYGVMTREVLRRRRELGVRIALGAQVGNIMALVLGRAARICFVGAAGGILTGYLATTLLENLLWGIEATDPVTFAGVGIGLLGLAVLVSIGPARRAARTQPMEILRG
jgi:putative ABC transport system permease protein